MPDKSFEKNVQEKLDGFNLPPSQKVWMRVEEELHKKNRRRGGVLWLFLGLMAVGVGSYFVYNAFPTNSGQPEIVSSEIQSVKESNLPAENDKTVDLEKSAESSKTETEEERKQNTRTVADLNNKRSLSPVEKLSNHTTDFARIGSRKEDAAINNRQENENVSTRIDEISETDTKSETPSIPSQPNEATKLPVENIATVKQDQIIEDIKTADADSASTSLTNLAKVSSDDSLSGNESKIIDKYKRKKSFEVGIKFSAGLSSLPENFLGSSNKSALADNFAPSSPGFPGLPPLNYTYDQQQSYGFEAGIWIRTPAGKKGSLSAGLDYTYLSTITTTGTVSNMNASVFNGYQSVSLNQYYLPGDLVKYRNQYHLLQIPLEYGITWGAKTRLPFGFTAGMQPGLLISSNALLKDNSGILYSDKSNYNKFQFGLSTGFNVRLFNRTKMPLDIGPVAQYQLTNSYRKNTGYKGHLFYLGFQVGLPLFNLNRQQR